MCTYAAEALGYAEKVFETFDELRRGGLRDDHTVAR
jgi:hypothetical protein